MTSSLSRIRPMSLITTSFVSRSRHPALCIAVLVGACTAPQSSPSVPQPGMPHNYTHLESEVLSALNKARVDPKGMAVELHDLAPFYKGRLFQRLEQATPVMTNEGVSALNEAITDVNSRLPLGDLTLDPLLTAAARDHVNDQSRTGYVGHTGSDGSSVESRVSRYAWWRVSLSENIDYSPAVHGSWVIESLLIDDGVADRGHRANIYSTTSKVIGIACGPHPRYGGMCVIVQAGGVTPK